MANLCVGKRGNLCEEITPVCGKRTPPCVKRPLCVGERLLCVGRIPGPGLLGLYQNFLVLFLHPKCSALPQIYATSLHAEDDTAK
eukprot:scaffold178104_cov21-Tisochrysis_lutea.AAC.2